jgi:hypothetical protein
MDDFNLDEVQTINSEYEPDINEIPKISNSSGFKRLKRRHKKPH